MRVAAAVPNVFVADAMENAKATVELVLKAVALAMGVGVVALTIMDEIEPRNALCLLGVGVACLALVQLIHEGDREERYDHPFRLSQ